MNKDMNFINELDAMTKLKNDPRTDWIILGGSQALGIVDEYSDFDVLVFGDYEHDEHLSNIIDADLKIHAVYKNTELIDETNPGAGPIYDSSTCVMLSLIEEPVVLYIKEGKEKLFADGLNRFKSKSNLASKGLLFYFRHTIKRCSSLIFELPENRRCKKHYQILLAGFSLSNTPLDINLLQSIKRMRIKNPTFEQYKSLKDIYLQILSSYDIFESPVQPLDQVGHHENALGEWHRIDNEVKGERNGN